MATFIKTDPSNGTQGTLPETAGTMIRQAAWGIDNTNDIWLVLYYEQERMAWSGEPGV